MLGTFESLFHWIFKVFFLRWLLLIRYSLNFILTTNVAFIIIICVWFVWNLLCKCHFSPLDCRQLDSRGDATYSYYLWPTMCQSQYQVPFICIVSFNLIKTLGIWFCFAHLIGETLGTCLKSASKWQSWNLNSAVSNLCVVLR